MRLAPRRIEQSVAQREPRPVRPRRAPVCGRAIRRLLLERVHHGERLVVRAYGRASGERHARVRVGRCACGRHACEWARDPRRGLLGEYGASVAGFSTASGIEDACALAKRAEAACDLPILVQLAVAEHKPKQGGPTDANPYYCPDAVVDAAVRLRASGVQFLRATGAATPAYTGALAATTAGLDVAACRTAGVPVADASVVAESPSSGDGRSEGESQVASATDEQMSALADALREKVAAAFSESGEA